MNNLKVPLAPKYASSQAPAWERNPGSSSFLDCEARASLSGFPSKSLGTSRNLDPLIKPLHLDTQEQEDLVEFLQTLTGSNTQILIKDAFAAPIGDSE